MFMDMDFPHPRHAEGAGLQQVDYSALIATATARQASSRALTALRLDGQEANDLNDRIAYFAQRSGNRAATPRGAFWITDRIAGCDQHPERQNKFECPVNLAGSTNGNSIPSYTIKPELQVAERGTEL